MDSLAPPAIPLPSYYPAEPSSIPRHQQATWLDRPSTPLVLGDVFMRRRNFVTSDLHVLLVTMDKAERVRMKAELGGLHYSTTAASSGKIAQAMLTERGGEFHMVMISTGLTGDGPDCLGLLAWIRELPALREVSLIVLGSFSVDPTHAVALIKAGANDILTRPIPVESLMRLRHQVGSEDNGGARGGALAAARHCSPPLPRELWSATDGRACACGLQVGTSQSLTQQRAHRREEGGTRLVTQYVLRKEREGKPDQMGLPPSVLDRKDGGDATPMMGEMTISILLLQVRGSLIAAAGSATHRAGSVLVVCW